MPKGNYLNTILKSSKTVLTLKDITLLWREPQTTAVRIRLNYYVKRGYLHRIRRGVYAKDENYNRLELATRIFTPSYVSLETVLTKEGLIFQYQTHITVVSYLTRVIAIDDQIYSYKKIKETVLIDPGGLKHENETSIASKERAFLDALYVNTDYYFDNLRSLDWDKVFIILPIYNNKRVVKKVNYLFKLSKTIV